MKERVQKGNKYLGLLAPHDIEQLYTLNRKLIALRCSEATLIEVELVFFDLLNILHENSRYDAVHKPLAELRSVREHQYKDAQLRHLTPRNLLINIKRFKNAVHTILLALLTGKDL